MTKKLCPLCKKNEEESNCNLVLDWKYDKENRGSVTICIECFDVLQDLKILKKTANKSIETQRYYSNLSRISCTCRFDENGKGNFRCPHCKNEVCILQ